MASSLAAALSLSLCVTSREERERKWILACVDNKEVVQQ